MHWLTVLNGIGSVVFRTGPKFFFTNADLIEAMDTSFNNLPVNYITVLNIPYTREHYFAEAGNSHEAVIWYTASYMI